MKHTKLISAFPGTGKSYFTHISTKIVLDSDSSSFDKKYFPSNYIKHIQKNIGIVDYICISSHEEVRKALVNEKMEFILVYPHMSLRSEYLNRYKLRSSTSQFLDLLYANWDNWVGQLIKQKDCTHVQLKSGEYLSDIIEKPTTEGRGE